MHTIAIFILLTTLSVIIWQDVKFRAIHWLTLPILFSSLMAYNYPINFHHLFQNILFVLALLFFITIYISIRSKRWILITREHFGIGDILFLIAITPISPTLGFMYIVIIGTLCSLLIALVLMLKKRQQHIPYAGYFSIFLFVYIIADCCSWIPTLNYIYLGNPQ